MYKKDERPYHIDYTFVLRELLESNIKVTVGEYDDWIDASDHMPLVVTI